MPGTIEDYVKHERELPPDTADTWPKKTWRPLYIWSMKRSGFFGLQAKPQILRRIKACMAYVLLQFKLENYTDSFSYTSWDSRTAKDF